MPAGGTSIFRLKHSCVPSNAVKKRRALEISYAGNKLDLVPRPQDRVPRASKHSSIRALLQWQPRTILVVWHRTHRSSMQSKSRRGVVSLSELLLALACPLAVQPRSPRSRAPVTQPIDENVMHRLAGNTRSQSNSQNDAGAVADDLAMERIGAATSNSGRGRSTPSANGALSTSNAALERKRLVREGSPSGASLVRSPPLFQSFLTKVSLPKLI